MVDTSVSVQVVVAISVHVVVVRLVSVRVVILLVHEPEIVWVSVFVVFR